MDIFFLDFFKDSYQIFINIFIIIFIGFFGWKTLSVLIKKKLDGLDSSKDEAQTQRIDTLFRILKNFASIAILIIVIMLILSELGIEIFSFIPKGNQAIPAEPPRSEILIPSLVVASCHLSVSGIEKIKSSSAGMSSQSPFSISRSNCPLPQPE